MGVLDLLRGMAASESDEPCEELRQARRLLAELRLEVDGNCHAWSYDFSRELAPLLEASREVQSQLVLELLANRKRWGCDAPWDRQRPAHELLNNLLRRSLPFDEDTLIEATRRFARNRPCQASVASFVGLLERCLPAGATGPALLEALAALESTIGEWGQNTQQDRDVKRRIGVLCGARVEQALETGELWTDGALEELSDMPEDARAAWQSLIDHAATAKSSRPSQKWLREAKKLCHRIRQSDPSGSDPVEVRLISWFSRVVKPKELARLNGEWGYTFEPPISDRNAVSLRGLVWTAGQIDSPAMLAAIARLAEVCFSKIRDFGAVNKKVGNACVFSLGHGPSLEGVAWLARLQNSIRYSSVRKLISKATDEAAERAGMTARDIEEIALPDFGLDADGVRRQPFGEWVALLELLPDDKTSITWHLEATETGGEKKQKSVPAAIKEIHASEIKQLRADAKAIQKLLPGQRSRFESFYLDQREWPYEIWRERYLEHPLAAHLARRLIWRFDDEGESRLGIWCERALVDVEGNRIEPGRATRVSLWHPLGSEVDDVLAWRRFLLRHRVVQPFKQAHREVYILTDAERETGVYSNRFAAHILKQHQVANLLAIRGWHYQLQGAWDSHNVPLRALERYDLTVQFWLDAIATEETSPAGIFVYVSSDQVCFTRLNGNERLPLIDVPALVFSEVMRDVDLFVSVSSIGADPTWGDDRRGEFTDYWIDYAFGELRESGQSRREILEQLLPSLAVSEKLGIQGKWLTVEGKLHRYRIHLGSGSIQMDPGGHVCIVPAPRGLPSGKLHLPYEGDTLLSIIVSKALLLVDDDKVQDKTIRRQIRR